MKITSAMDHASGIPLGGLGTGSVEIRADGYFHEWQIFNLGVWTAHQPESCRAADPEMDPGALSFFVRAGTKSSAPIMRRLGLRSDQHNVYSFAWLQSVQEIEYTGSFPVTRLVYRDADLPLAVEATFFSPFIPHESRISGTPGFFAVYKVRNLSDQPVDASILATLKNPLARGAEDRRLTNRVSRDSGTTFLTMRTAADMPCKATLGSLCLSVSGGEASWIAGEFEQYFNGYIITHFAGVPTPFGTPHECFLHEYRASGKLPSLSGSIDPSGLLRMAERQIDALSPDQQSALLRRLKQYPFIHAMWQRVARVEPKVLRSREGVATFLKQVGIRLDSLAGRDRKGQSWGDAALSCAVSLGPEEEKEIRFALGWHFPNLITSDGRTHGHMYENWFEDAEAVCRYLGANGNELGRRTIAFAETLADTNLPHELPEAWSAQLSTLAKCTWWTRDGRFAVWEGLGCCGFHTTDITYQGSFSILALFPELQQSQMRMGAKFQRADGRVHHVFNKDFSTVDDGFDRVDMNPQFVLLVCRDWLWTGDRRYLRTLWPHVVRAMDAAGRLDTNHDGLPDRDTRRNTYDVWDFAGTPSYIASLWISSLRAAICLAEAMGERARATEWGRLLKRGVASFEKLLWNGEYYSLWVDGRQRDESCMTDQLDGEWFTGLIGLGYCLPHERIRAALRAIVRHNFGREDGLVNASYPPGTKRQLRTHGNYQATGLWTGIEYAIASMLLELGMQTEGLAVVQRIHQRYLRAGRFWNHVECGEHYYRAMSSWALLLAATGFKMDVPGRSLCIRPVIGGPEVRAPWVSSSGWGSFAQTSGSFQLVCKSGELSFRELRLGLKKKPVAADLNGRKLRAAFAQGREGSCVRFQSVLRLRKSDSLEVRSR